MKRFLMGTLVVLTLGSAAQALDAGKLEALEREGGQLMQTVDAPSLQAWEAANASKLSSADAKAKFLAGVVAHNLSRALPGKGWATKAVERLQGPSQAPSPELAVIALAYLGSAKALQANDDANPAMKIVLVNQGWDLLDQAVTRTGEGSFLPRFLRASVGSSLPEFFGKAPSVVVDTRALAQWAQTHPGRLDQTMVAQIALMEGNALKRTKDLDGAVAAWKRAVVLDAEKKGPGKAAADLLDLYEE